MKARIRVQIPERVLTFAIEEEVRPKLTAVLEELGLGERLVTTDELGCKVGYLAGFYGYDGEAQPYTPPAEARGVLCMSGMSDSRMDALLTAVERQGVDLPLKAIVTAVNQNWPFGQLIEELIQERAALTGGKA